jgi:zeaxanthin glucosyltransferase
MHFGCICDNGPSHVMCAAAVGRALENRGHRFTLFAFPHLRTWIEREGTSAIYLPHSRVLTDRLQFKDGTENLSPSQIIGGLVHDVNYVQAELPGPMRAAALDCMIVDANLPAAASVAQTQSLPFVTLCIALPPHEEPSLPPLFLPWTYRNSAFARTRNRIAYRVRDYMVRPILAALNSFRKTHGLAPFRRFSDSLSELAQISQLVAEFDLPRTNLPACFHYTGPYLAFRKAESPFPWERLDGRPLIYSALGTVLGGDAEIWRQIAQACEPLDAQLVIALGSRDSKLVGMQLPGDPIVAGYAPQEALLARAALSITHAGLNSVLESLAHGVPMLAVPFVADQTGIASRIVYRGLGESVARRTSPEKMAAVLRRLLTSLPTKERCKTVADAIGKAGGAARAAEIIERAASTGRPVLRENTA